MRKCAVLAAVICLLLIPNVYAQTQGGTAKAARDSEAEWNGVVDQVLESLFKINPTFATYEGVHTYDAQLEDVSRAGIDNSINTLRDLEQRVAAVKLEGAPLSVREDQELVLSKLRGRLLDLESIRNWERNPDFYSSGASRAAFVLINRNFAPPEQRLKSLIERERKMPAMFAAARSNLKNPPQIYTQIALEQLPGIISFFQKDVPSAFSGVKDPKLLAEFKQTNGAVINELNRYENYLHTDVLPVSKGDFAIGADNYSKKLLCDEMVDVPLDRLLEIGKADMQRNQEELKAVAAKAYPGKTVEQALAALSQDHPPADRILQTFAANFSGLRQFITSHDIVRIPSPESPKLQETPPFMRALTFASMNSPGPFEKVATDAFFNVSLPEKNWTPAQVNQQLQFFNNYAITDIAIHEAYPGHYTQFLYVRTEPMSKVRKVFGCSSNAEGWAHYSEQMMLDEGFSNGDPKMRMSQLQQALLRDARYIAGISMHTHKMTMEQATDMFEKQAYMPHGPALRETMRGTSDPTYLVYTLGKLEILKLREDYKKQKGAGFNLEQFHTEFLQQGFPPIKLIRETMLGNAGPVL